MASFLPAWPVRKYVDALVLGVRPQLLRGPVGPRWAILPIPVVVTGGIDRTSWCAAAPLVSIARTIVEHLYVDSGHILGTER